MYIFSSEKFEELEKDYKNYDWYKKCDGKIVEFEINGSDLGIVNDCVVYKKWCIEVFEYLELLKMIKDNKIAEGTIIKRLYKGREKGTYIYKNRRLYIKSDCNSSKTLEQINTYPELFISVFKIGTVDILDSVEKEYLKNIIKPFKNKIKYISKCGANDNEEFIYMKVEGSADLDLPRFRKGTMYRKMQRSCKYTLSELRLED